MTYTNDDRADVADIGSAVIRVLENIAHHDVGDLSEGWSVVGDDTAAEITRLRERLDELAVAAAAGLAELRRVEIREGVREVWAPAFATGRVRDHETDPGDTEQLNIVGVVDALISAETDLGPEHSREQIREHLQVRLLEDQVFERILDHEPGGADGSALLDEQSNRAAAVVSAFVAAVYS